MRRRRIDSDMQVLVDEYCIIPVYDEQPFPESKTQASSGRVGLTLFHGSCGEAPTFIEYGEDKTARDKMFNRLIEVFEQKD